MTKWKQERKKKQNKKKIVGKTVSFDGLAIFLVDVVVVASLQAPHVVIQLTFRFYLIAFAVWASVRARLP